MYFYTIIIFTTNTVANKIIEPHLAKTVLRNHHEKKTRNNNGVFEEQLTANYERECKEENCSLEELDEIFVGDESVKDVIKHGPWNKIDFKATVENPCHFQKCHFAT